MKAGEGGLMIVDIHFFDLFVFSSIWYYMIHKEGVQVLGNGWAVL
jgi:hypothetical protein